MAMTGVYGWSLGRGVLEKIIFAASLAAVDFGGFYLIRAASTYTASNELSAARWAKSGAILCCLVTVTGMVGFQSESREAQVQSRKQAAKIANDVLDWSKGLAVNAVGATKGGKDKTNSATTLEAGIEAVGRLAEQQMNKLNSGQIASVDDGQALAIARVTGLSEDTARSWYIFSLSIVLLLIQYAFGWHYGFTRHRLEPALAAQMVNLGNSRYSTGNSKNSSKTQVEAREDLAALLQGGFDPAARGSQTFLAQRWGWPPNTTGRWLRNQPDLNMPPPGRRGRKARHVNGSTNGTSFIPQIMKAKLVTEN